jgi:hypothetical protein
MKLFRKLQFKEVLGSIDNPRNAHITGFSKFPPVVIDFVNPYIHWVSSPGQIETKQANNDSRIFFEGLNIKNDFGIPSFGCLVDLKLVIGNRFDIAINHMSLRVKGVNDERCA